MSNETRWTPGPWVAMDGCKDIFGPLGGESGDGWEADETDGWKVAEVGQYLTFAHGQETELGEECRRANAHLIAAAPDMADALMCWPLSELLGMVEDSGDTAMRERAKWFMEVRDFALAKARGETS